MTNRRTFLGSLAALLPLGLLWPTKAEPKKFSDVVDITKKYSYAEPGKVFVPNSCFGPVTSYRCLDADGPMSCGDKLTMTTEGKVRRVTAQDRTCVGMAALEPVGGRVLAMIWENMR